MGLIKEPVDVDFVVEPRMLTKHEKEQISAYIKDCLGKTSVKDSRVKRKRVTASVAKTPSTK